MTFHEITIIVTILYNVQKDYINVTFIKPFSTTMKFIFNR